jgi:hypothetical protein
MTTEDDSETLKRAMMAEFSHFDPRVQKIISLSNHIKRWPLFIHDPLPTWVRGRVVLIGDAAHPMLPFGGQGAAQAMEDGAALGVLLKDHKHTNLETALRAFEEVRKNRTARVQTLSTVRPGLEAKVADKIGPYLDESAPKAPTSLPERVVHDFRYDAPVDPGGPTVDRLTDTLGFPVATMCTPRVRTTSEDQKVENNRVIYWLLGRETRVISRCATCCHQTGIDSNTEDIPSKLSRYRGIN